MNPSIDANVENESHDEMMHSAKHVLQNTLTTDVAFHVKCSKRSDSIHVALPRLALSCIMRSRGFEGVIIKSLAD